MNAVTQTNATETGQQVEVAKRAAPIVEFKRQMDMRVSEFGAALPAHIPAERYARVLMTAVQTNPELLTVERRSLFNAAMKCAQDGLLPDGREAALVVYLDYKLGKIAQYMPMIAGLRKKVRNSKEMEDWNAQVVHAKDQFEYELGDNPFIRHKPYMGEGDNGPVIAAYSIAKFKSGELSREVMTWAQIEKIRARSNGWKAYKAGKIKSTPWSTDEGEMARKTVARRHSKVLPMSTDLDDLVRRDDDLYDLEGKSDKAIAAPRSLGDRLDMLAGTAPSQIEHDAETGEVIEHEPSDDQNSGDQPEATAGESPTTAGKGAEVAETSPAASAPKSEPAKPKAADQTKATADDRRKAILADLTRQGDENAASGSRALSEWLDGLTGDENALISGAQVKAWKSAAARADG